MKRRASALAALAAFHLAGGRANGDGAGRELAALVPALEALDGDLATFATDGDEAQVTTLVAAPPDAVAALLRDPAAYRQAVPALARTDVIARRPRSDGDADLLVEWELEIPLFNLAGRLWVIPGAGEVTLDLFQGNFAPGRLVFTWAPAGPGRAVAALSARINNQAGGWLLRQLVARSRFAGAAVNAAAAFVALRGLAAVAEHPRDSEARRPHAAPAPVALAAIDGRALGERLVAAPSPSPRALGLVRRAPSGRLSLAAVAARGHLPGAATRARLETPEVWHAFPGWKRVERLPPSEGAGGGVVDVEVRDNIPFVDFDARWRLTPSPVPRALVIDGDARGAVLGWDVVEASPPRLPATAIVLSMNPRVEKLGYVPRKFVAAEPLLEQALALALAYVDALSVVESQSLQ
ncbi:MAG TPA: hypothetical protein VMU50_13895 [Polyangia bacterium]|nr:hypothetical protein [Polyangia bacterium]